MFGGLLCHKSINMEWNIIRNVTRRKTIWCSPINQYGLGLLAFNLLNSSTYWWSGSRWHGQVLLIRVRCTCIGKHLRRNDIMFPIITPYNSISFIKLCHFEGYIRNDLPCIRRETLQNYIKTLLKVERVKILEFFHIFHLSFE